MPKKLPAEQRKHQILQILAQMLEETSSSKITTASIAANAQVSEATLYRHFTNKEHLFAELLQFAETSVFSLINKINQDEQLHLQHLDRIITVLFKFSEQNPGIIRLLIHAEPLTQSKALGKQSKQFFSRLESQFKQNSQRANLNVDHVMAANLLIALVEGKLQYYVRSGFKQLPSEHWDTQWRLLQNIYQG